ncbi:MAG: STAS domain-containing protein [Spirochaetia bacterium]|nr:STAS domain-containing protein [Spirochaetia bacterium]
MIADVEFIQDAVKIKINETKIDGQNSIFELLIEKKILTKKIEKIIIDFENVIYINSLGIAEFISLMRYYSEKRPKMKYKFINVDKKISKIFKMIELDNIADIESK